MLFSAQSLQCSQPLVRWYADLQWYKVQVIYSSEPCGTQVSGGGTVVQSSVVQWYSGTLEQYNLQCTAEFRAAQQ